MVKIQKLSEVKLFSFALGNGKDKMVKSGGSLFLDSDIM